MSAPEAAALAALDPDELVADLAALVRIPSVTGDERAALEHLAERARALGLETALDTHDLAAVRADPEQPGEDGERDELLGLRAGLPGGLADRGRPRLALCAHVDVVPAGTASWRHGAWSATVDDGRLHGRGSADMKAGVVAALHALAAVHRAGVRPPCDPVLLAVSSEEDGGLGAFAALRADARYDGCVIPEPTAFAVVCAQAGAITFRGEVRGVGAHAAFRREGVSAIDRYVRVHAALAALEVRLNAAVDDPLMAALALPYPVLVGRLAAGEWASTVPDRLTFEGRAPVRVGESVEQARATVEAAVVAALDGDGLPPVTLTWPGARFASARTSPEHPLARTVLEATAQERGSAAPGGVPWGADMRLFAARGIPTVMVGPRPHAIHGVDEHVVVAEALATARILVRTLCRFPGGG
ncbi:M20/M25/M40 family metallo-hydrolase [Paraconexibacter algicola]|uniref:Peptidase M20 n=1 Tax=Paraconexibacter algicola TaxID=2133960 RepID=A0A2T4UBB8_9ACTN|nr:M20/M25/M40 family metallo-hydrolase [Paraconexibacter algicola]PTL54162.1 peptidase M20 [Paraconexibacter algicola]